MSENNRTVNYAPEGVPCNAPKSIRYKDYARPTVRIAFSQATEAAGQVLVQQCGRGQRRPCRGAAALTADLSKVYGELIRTAGYVCKQNTESILEVMMALGQTLDTLMEHGKNTCDIHAVGFHSVGVTDTPVTMANLRSLITKDAKTPKINPTLVYNAILGVEIRVTYFENEQKLQECKWAVEVRDITKHTNFLADMDLPASYSAQYSMTRKQTRECIAKFYDIFTKHWLSVADISTDEIVAYVKDHNSLAGIKSEINGTLPTFVEFKTGTMRDKEYMHTLLKHSSLVTQYDEIMAAMEEN